MIALILLVVGLVIAGLGYRSASGADIEGAILSFGVVVVGAIIALVGVVWAFVT